MSIFISHTSALEYWRKHRVIPDSGARQSARVSLPDNPPTTELVKSVELVLPVHILVGKPMSRWSTQTMKQHVYSEKPVVGCFVKVADELWVCSPEYCFLQMAGELTLPMLIELGYELCSQYSLPASDDRNPPERGFYYREPLTSVKKLEAFIALMPAVRGSKKAKRAIRYLLDNSASPMETKLAILLTLPYLLGGYGFIAPELNSRIIPSKTVKRSVSKTFYSCDLYWPDYYLAVEYDSAQHHSGSEQINSDAKKKNALTLMGITVITVTKQQLYNGTEFEKVARVIANCLGKRLKFNKGSFALIHAELRRQLFPE